MPIMETHLKNYIKNADFDKNNLIRQLSAAIYSIHSCGYIHRDLKPRNILIKNDKMYIIDFGSTMYVGNINKEILTLDGFQTLWYRVD